MTHGPYLYERQVEYWTSREIEGFFMDSGFEVLVMPITQLTEQHVPADFLFMDTQSNKLFGLQYKVLYHNKEDHWNLQQDQHHQLSVFNWMFYGLSDMQSPRQHRNALHYLRVIEPAFPFTARLTKGYLQRLRFPRYVRWAAFYEGLRACKYGRKIDGRADLRKALWPHHNKKVPREIREIADEVLIANFEAGKAVRYSSIIRQEQ